MAEAPLIGVDDAAALFGDSAVRVADTRWYLGEPEAGRVAYHEAHVPGATYVDLEAHLSAPEGPGRHPLPDPDAFAATLGRLGFGDRHLVVAYDDRGGAVAARLWWMLRWIGHRRVRVLDGGLPAWREAGLPVTATPARLHRARMSVRSSPSEPMDRHQVAEGLGSLRLLDARAPERYRGEEEPIDPIAGHIPTAVNLPYESLLDGSGRFLPASRLAVLLGDLDESTVVYCGSGVTACHLALAAVAAGLSEPALYPGSWSDWISAGMPVATGPEPGVSGT